jgi:hypothetical protein
MYVPDSAPSHGMALISHMLLHSSLRRWAEQLGVFSDFVETNNQINKQLRVVPDLA